MRSPVFPRLWSACWAPGSTAPAYATCLPATPRRRRWRRLGRGRIGRTIRKRSPRLAAALTNAVVTALEAQTVAVPAEAVTGRMIAELAVELDRVRGRRDQLASEIAQLFEAHPFGRILGSLPGVGPRTGSTILAEIGDGSRFANGSRLASYAGLAPVTRQSGSSIRGQSRSRRGNHRLKNAMFLAAFADAAFTAARIAVIEFG